MSSGGYEGGGQQKKGGIVQDVKGVFRGIGEVKDSLEGNPNQTRGSSGRWL